jgi:predicted MFS family arabinose efflux permease
MSAATLLVVLGPALAFSIAQVDPLLFSLSLTTISDELNVPADRMGLLGGASTLVVAAAVLAVGNLGDRYGLKRLLIYGLLANIVVNLLEVLAPTYQVLLVMRFLDGLSLTSLLGLSLALLTVSVSPEVRPTAIGVMMAINTVLYGVTPLLTGWLMDTFGWRSLFFVTPPLALVAVLLTARHTGEPDRQQPRRLDVLGVVLFGVALLGLVYGLANSQGGFSQPAVWIPLSCAAVALAFFVSHERHVPEPALDLRLFTRPAFTVAVVAVVTLNFMSSGMGTVLGQFGGYVLQLSSQTIGLLYLPGTIVVAVASVLAGRVITAHGARPVIVFGMLTLVASGLVMAGTASITMATALLVLATWLTNLGGFVTATGTSDTVVSQAPPGKTGSVASVHPAFAMTGYAIGPAVYLLLLNLMFQKEWLADAATRGLSSKQAADAVDAVTSSMVAGPGSAQYDASLLEQASGLTLGIDYSTGLRITFLIVSLVPLGVAVLAYFLMPHRRTAHHERDATDSQP